MSGISSSPSTRSAVEYIGEVSIRRAPEAKNASSTSLRGARSAADSPTSKVREVPKPMMGSSFGARGDLAHDQRSAGVRSARP